MNRFLIPGWCLGRGPLQPLADALNARFIDLPGYGDTAPEADFTAAVDRLVHQLPDGSTLAGWSLGALLALAAAAQAPHKVRRLVLIAGTASFVQRPDWTAAVPPATLDTFVEGVAQDVEALLPRFVGGFNRGEDDARAVTRQLLAVADPRPPVPVLMHGLRWLQTVDLRDRLAAIHTPTLLVHGEHDPLMPLAAARALAERLADARLHYLPGTAHAPFVSAFADVHAAIEAFLTA